nr:hypothetical protein BCV12_21090 [Vibrio cyclitrophicus]
MLVKKLILTTVLSVVLVGCQSTKLNTAVIDSSGYVVDKELLSQYSNLVVTDELEGRFYYTGADYDEWLLGQAYRKIKFTFHPDSSDGKVEVDVRTMQLDWVHADSVTIFIGKNKVVEKWQSRKYTNTSIVDGGNNNSFVYTHEHFTIPVSIKDAKKIANASSDEITLRFYGKQGYVDEKIHPMSSWKNLKGVVILAENTTPK